MINIQQKDDAKLLSKLVIRSGESQKSGKLAKETSNKWTDAEMGRLVVPYDSMPYLGLSPKCFEPVSLSQP